MRLEAFAPSAPAARDPPRLRALLALREAELGELGTETEVATLPDDLFVAAAAAGALTCIPFLDILDGGCFARAPCLCCYAAHSAAQAREASAALRIYQRYYDDASYLGSRAYARTVAALSRDLREGELAEVASFLATLDSTSDAVREINGRWGGRMCVAVPPCRPGTLWVYSTADGRRLLRHLARGLRKGGPPVKVTVASSDPTAFPRYRYRMYAAALAEPEGPPSPEAPGEPGTLAGEPLLEAALAWSRTQDPPGGPGTSTPRSGPRGR